MYIEKIIKSNFSKLLLVYLTVYDEQNTFIFSLVEAQKSKLVKITFKHLKLSLA